MSGFGFNSTMVQLKYRTELKAAAINDLFQFHNGSIKILLNWPGALETVTFQFHNGSIKIANQNGINLYHP